MRYEPNCTGQTEVEQRCFTRQISDEFSGCLAERKRHRCIHAFLFGDGYLCTHPRHREFR